MLAGVDLVNILDLPRILPSFHVLSDNCHKLHNNNTFREEATNSLPLDLWLCHKQVGHQGLDYFDQGNYD